MLDNAPKSATEAPPVAGMGAQEDDIARLRKALIEMGRMIPGCALRDEVSTDFLMLLPEEMRLWKEKALTKTTPPEVPGGSIPAGMKPYGPDHLDYPAPPTDYAVGPVVFRKGTSGDQARVDDPALLFGEHTDGALDVIAYTSTPPASVSASTERQDAQVAMGLICEATTLEDAQAIAAAFLGGRDD